MFRLTMDDTHNLRSLITCNSYFVVVLRINNALRLDEKCNYTTYCVCTFSGVYPFLPLCTDLVKRLNFNNL